MVFDFLRLFAELIPFLFELADDACMFCFSQRNFCTIDERRENQEDDRASEHNELEVEQGIRRDICSGSTARHADPDSDQADDAARNSTSEFINERTYAEADSFIAVTNLELAILDRVRNRHEDNEEDKRLRQSEEACTDKSHRDIRAGQRVNDERYEHDANRCEEEFAAAEFRRESWEQGNSDQADDRVDDTEDGEFRSIADDIDEVIEVEVVDDVDADTINEVCDSRPHELVVLRQDFEYVFCGSLRLVLTKSTVLLMRAKAEDDSTERCDTAADAGECEPASWVTGTAVLIQREVKDNRHDDDRDEVGTENGTDTGNRSRDITFMGIKGKSRNHGPDSDILSAVEDIHDEVNDGEQDEVQRRVRDRQAAKVREQQCQRDGCNEGANDDPWFKTAPTGFRLIDEVADERIDEQLQDTEYEDDRRNDADHVSIMTRAVRMEQVTRDEDHEISTDHGVEDVMTKRAARIADALQ